MSTDHLAPPSSAFKSSHRRQISTAFRTLSTPRSVISWGEQSEGICCAISAVESVSDHLRAANLSPPLEIAVHFYNVGSSPVYITPSDVITHIWEVEQNSYVLGLRVDAAHVFREGAHLLEAKEIRSFRVLATPLDNLPDGEYKLVRHPLTQILAS